MDDLTGLIGALNSLSPLAIIGLLGFIIFFQVRNQRDNSSQLTKIETNDLHQLPDMVETLQRIEVMLSREFAFIRARLNNGKDS